MIALEDNRKDASVAAKLHCMPFLSLNRPAREWQRISHLGQFANQTGYLVQRLAVREIFWLHDRLHGDKAPMGKLRIYFELRCGG